MEIEKGMVSNALKGMVKKLLAYLGLAFLFVFTVLAVNQLGLVIGPLRENQATFAQGIVLFLYSLPAIIVMGAPYAVCTGFVCGLIKMNFMERVSQNRRSIIPVLILGVLVSILTFMVSDFVLPNSNKNINKLYWTISARDGIPPENPRAMSSLELLQKIGKINDDKKTLNIYTLELNKKYSIPSGGLFFAFFAISLSVVLKRRLKTALCISLISCVVYWAFLVYGQLFSLNYEKYGALVMWFPNIFFLCISIILCLLKYKNNLSVSMRRAGVK
jgi:lipopolysaccharide export LptBFGC system permease protein LptF